jgi:predicted anti-sigma-YlaC factor YlaD
MGELLPLACERARAWSSLALDHELSELEREHLRAHLAECEDCESFLITAREVTHELRAAPLPVPSRPLLPKTHRGLRTPLLLALLAVLVASAVGGIAGSSRPTPAPVALHFVTPQKLPGSRLPHQTAV